MKKKGNKGKEKRKRGAMFCDSQKKVRTGGMWYVLRVRGRGGGGDRKGKFQKGGEDRRKGNSRKIEGLTSGGKRGTKAKLKKKEVLGKKK